MSPYQYGRPVASETDGAKFGRRTALKTGLTGLAASLGFSRTASAYHGTAGEYSTVINMVDAGADPTGDESIVPILEKYRGDDTLLKFPDGRYYMDEKFRFTDFEHFGLLGIGDATLVPANRWNFEDDGHKLFRLGTNYAPGDDLHIENFKVDFTGNATGVRPFEATVEDDLTVRNIDIVGRHDSGTWGPGLFRVSESGGTGLVEGFRAPDGAAGNNETGFNFLSHGGPSGILCNYGHKGTITFRDCVLGGFPDNGLYAEGGSGKVIVEGGVYRNSGTASIRIGADRGTISGARVVVDDDPFGIPQEGIRLDYGGWFNVKNTTINIKRPNGEALNVMNAVGGAFLKDSSLYMGKDAHPGVKISQSTGPTYLRDVDVEMDGSNHAVQIRGTDAGEVGLENVSVTGDAGGQTLRHAIYCERDDCDFRELDIDQPGGNKRRGLVLLGDDAFVYRCEFTCSQEGITVKGDGASIGDCYSNPYENDRWSVRVFDSASSTQFWGNNFPDGIHWN